MQAECVRRPALWQEGRACGMAEPARDGSLVDEAPERQREKHRRPGDELGDMGNPERSFIPQQIYGQYEGKLASEMKPVSQRALHVVMFADISGFTKLTKRCNEQGSAGIDMLFLSLNDFLTKIIDQIYANEGDVVKIAGDCLICSFPARSEDLLREAAENACHCACEIASLRTEDLCVHIGISHGVLETAILGDPSMPCDFLFGGPVLDEVALALNSASDAEVIATARLGHLIGEDPEGTFSSVLLEGVDGLVKIERRTRFVGGDVPLSRSRRSSRNNLQDAQGEQRESSRSPRSMSPFRRLSRPGSKGPDRKTSAMAAKILQNIRGLQQRANGASSQAQRTADGDAAHRLFMPQILSKSAAAVDKCSLREVTTMFVLLKGYTRDAKENLLQLQEAYVQMVSAVRENGGFTRQFVVDDKGCMFIACWGVPSFSHSDDAFRATTTAVSILYGLESISMPVSIGIATGRSYCGCIGSRQRREYTVLGDSVNRAARFVRCGVEDSEGNALPVSSTGVFIDEETKDTCRSNAKFFQPLSLRSFKGMGAVPVYALATESVSRKTKNHVVERGNLFARFTRWITKLARASHSQAVLVVGDNGSGKTLAFQEFKRRAKKLSTSVAESYVGDAAEEIIVFNVSCAQTGRDWPLGVFRKIFRLTLNLSGKATASQKEISRLAAKIFKGDPERQQMFQGLISCALTKGGQEDLLCPRQEMLSILLTFFKRLTNKRPVVLLLDDAHEMDWRSSAAIRRFCEPASMLRMLVMCSTLDTYKSDVEQYLKQNGTLVEKVVLRPFTEEEVSRLLHSMHPTMERSMLARTAHMVWTVGSGNPFWCAELARAIVSDSDEMKSARKAQVRVKIPGLSSLLGLTPGESEEAETETEMRSRGEKLQQRMNRVISSKYDAMSQELQNFLDVCCIMRPPFRISWVGGFLGLSDEDASRVVRVACDERFLVPMSSAKYRFVHPRMHASIYGAMPPSVAKERHENAKVYCQRLLSELQERDEEARMDEAHLHLEIAFQSSKAGDAAGAIMHAAEAAVLFVAKSNFAMGNECIQAAIAEVKDAAAAEKLVALCTLLKDTAEKKSRRRPLAGAGGVRRGMIVFKRGTPLSAGASQQQAASGISGAFANSGYFLADTHIAVLEKRASELGDSPGGADGAADDGLGDGGDAARAWNPAELVESHFRSPESPTADDARLIAKDPSDLSEAFSESSRSDELATPSPTTRQLSGPLWGTPTSTKSDRADQRGQAGENADRKAPAGPSARELRRPKKRCSIS